MNITKLALLLSISLISITSFADIATAKTLNRSLDVLLILETALERARRGEKTTSELKEYEIELQKGAETFFQISNDTAKENKSISEALGVSGQAIVDSAYAIYIGTSAKKGGRIILNDSEAKANVLPNVYLGVINELIQSHQTKKPLLTKEEILGLRKGIKERFGSRISYEGVVNGDTGFSKTASLIDSCLSVLANP